MTRARIGIVGLGAMGSQVGEHLIDLGEAVVVFDQEADRVAPLAARGAVVGSSVADLAGAVDWVMLFLPGPDDVVEVTSALASAATLPKGLVDFTTSDPSVSASVASTLGRAGVRYLDAGVLGNPPLARTGSLLLLLGCAEQEAESVSGILSLISRQSYYLGRVGGGHAAKLAANELFTSQVAAMAEALAILHALGADQEVFLEALSATGGRGVGLADIGKTMRGDPPATGFALRLAAKDVELLRRLAEGAGASLPLVSALASMFGSAAAANGDADYTRLYHHLLARQTIQT